MVLDCVTVMHDCPEPARQHKAFRMGNSDRYLACNAASFQEKCGSDRAQLHDVPLLRFRSFSTVFQVYTGSLPLTASFAQRNGSNLQFSMKGCFRASSFAGCLPLQHKVAQTSSANDGVNDVHCPLCELDRDLHQSYRVFAIPLEFLVHTCHGR